MGNVWIGLGLVVGGLDCALCGTDSGGVGGSGGASVELAWTAVGDGVLLRGFVGASAGSV